MLELLRRRSTPLTTAGLILVSLALLVTNSRGGQRVDPLGVVFLELVTPIADLGTHVSSTLTSTWSAYVDLVGARQEREWLRTRVRALEEDADQASAISDENERLRALLGLRDTLPTSAVAARITGAEASGLFRTATLNKGEADGVSEGFAVIAGGGVVGRVVATSPHASRVLLLDDHASGVDALVRRTRARGIVEGGSQAGCRLKYVKRREDIRVGDKVITSGLDGIFPKGLAIGEIVQLSEEEHGLYRTAEVRPAVEFAKLEEVLVVEPPTREVPPPPTQAAVTGDGPGG